MLKKKKNEDSTMNADIMELPFAVHRTSLLKLLKIVLHLFSQEWTCSD